VPRTAALACLLALLAGLTAPLWDQDEAAYAGFALRMVETGDWLVPAFTWSDVHRKPPLTSWMIASSFSAFGVHTWSARLPGVLSFIGTCAALAWLGAPLFGRERARDAALVLGTSLALIGGKIALTDTPLLMCTTVVILTLLARMAGDTRSTTLALFWAGVAAALLTKGPAIVVTLGVAFLVLLAHPNRRALLVPVLGLPLAAAPLLAWGWAAWRDDPATIQWMIDWYILRRGQVLFGQTGPPGTFALTLLVFLFPWSAALPGALRQLWRERRDPLNIGLWAWLAGGWIVWEMFPTKLPMYAAGAWPAVALLVAPYARSVFRRVPSDIPWTRSMTIVLTLAFGCLFLAAGWIAPLAATPALALALLPRARHLAGPAMIVLFWTVGLPALRPRLMVTADVAEAAIACGAPVAFAEDMHLPSLPFYVEASGLDHRTLAKGEATGAGETRVERGPPVVGGASRATTIDGWIPDKGTPVRFSVTCPAP
jgi:4-amino-4-deoxy-L-arabinose transferase-like glycosyltransferase